MTVHIERCHHRTSVKRALFSRRWYAGCLHCGFGRWLDTQHDAFIVALAHAQGSLR